MSKVLWKMEGALRAGLGLYQRYRRGRDDNDNLARDVLVGSVVQIGEKVISQGLSSVAKEIHAGSGDVEFPDDSLSIWDGRPGIVGDYVEASAYAINPMLGAAVSAARGEINQQNVAKQSLQKHLDDPYNQGFTYASVGQFSSSRGVVPYISPRARLSAARVYRKHNMSYKRRAVPRKKVAAKRTKQTRFGRYPLKAMKAVDESDGRLELASDLASRYSGIPKRMPGNLKYFDDVMLYDATSLPNGVGGKVLADSATFTLGIWDPLAIAINGVAPANYTNARSASSSRSADSIVVVAIEIQVVLYDPVPVRLFENGSYTANGDYVTAMTELGAVQQQLKFILDRQCNGLLFTQNDLDQLVDVKSATTVEPFLNSMYTLDNVTNDGRFEVLSTITTPSRDFPEMDNAFLYTTATVAAHIPPQKDYGYKLALKGPWRIDYAPLQSGFGSGDGALNTRRNVNINAIWSINTDIGPGNILFTSPFARQPGIQIMSRTIYYDSSA